MKKINSRRLLHLNIWRVPQLERQSRKQEVCSRQSVCKKSHLECINLCLRDLDLGEKQIRQSLRPRDVILEKILKIAWTEIVKNYEMLASVREGGSVNCGKEKCHDWTFVATFHLIHLRV